MAFNVLRWERGHIPVGHNQNCGRIRRCTDGIIPGFFLGFVTALYWFAPFDWRWRFGVFFVLMFFSLGFMHPAIRVFIAERRRKAASKRLYEKILGHDLSDDAMHDETKAWRTHVAANSRRAHRMPD